MPQMAGDDVDIIIREWEYWPFTAGLDGITIHKEDANPDAAALELFIRMALLTQKQPAVHFLKMSHAKAGGELGWLNKWVNDKDGMLHQYSEFALQGFDAFGRPFDKLRKRTPAGKRMDNGAVEPKPCPEDGLSDVGACPIDNEHFDGFHKRARHLGFNETEHPDWKVLVDLMGQKHLFVNWHPAPLGHEVIGHQMAFYYLQLMVKALERLVAADQGGTIELLKSELRMQGGSQPLPAPKHCAHHVCQDRPRCAYSFLPKAMGPDVGDWMVNQSSGGATNWVNKGTGESPCESDRMKVCTELFAKKKTEASKGLTECEQNAQKGGDALEKVGDCEEAECIKVYEKCGYRDEKRGMYGVTADQPLTLKV
jgi:hypothetical protein